MPCGNILKAFLHMYVCIICTCMCGFLFIGRYIYFHFLITLYLNYFLFVIINKFFLPFNSLIAFAYIY